MITSGEKSGASSSSVQREEKKRPPLRHVRPSGGRTDQASTSAPTRGGRPGSGGIRPRTSLNDLRRAALRDSRDCMSRAAFATPIILGRGASPRIQKVPNHRTIRLDPRRIRTRSGESRASSKKRSPEFHPMRPSIRIDPGRFNRKQPRRPRIGGSRRPP